MGNFSGKIFLENIVGKFCGKSCLEILWAILQGNLPEKVLMVCNRSKNGKNYQHGQFLALLRNF